VIPVAGIVGSNPAGCLAVSCECCVLSGRGLCDRPIPRKEESYRVVCVCVRVLLSSGAAVTFCTYSEWVEEAKEKKKSF
jgi:hypothetical protein